MCFSATASFSAFVLIGAAGVVTYTSCKRPEQKVLGAVPFLFALQQLCEGFVWLSFTEPGFGAIQHLASVCFLVFAWLVWPVMIPLAFYRLEPPGRRRLWCKRLIYVGMASAAYATFNLAAKYPVPSIATFHIIYNVTKSYYHDFFFLPHQFAYLCATVLPMFLSTLKGSRLLAAANFVALLVAFVLFQKALPSTWCFFAAFLSLIIYYMIRVDKRMDGFSPSEQLSESAPSH